MTPHGSFSPKAHADILLREYGALYGLIQLRLGALETRAMLAWAALGGFLTGLMALPSEHWLAMCVATPPLLAWLFRTTVNHARSLEDAFRRVEEIEKAVNRTIGADLLRFQSTHPSRGNTTGGRTGRESVLTVLCTSVVVITLSGALAWPHAGHMANWMHPVVLAYFASNIMYCMRVLTSLKSYTYRPAPASDQYR